MRILSTLDQSENAKGMDLPGFQLHVLRGDMKDRYSVRVSANWRVTFEFLGGDAVDVDFVDYH